VLGRFLELSVAAPDVPASLAFYESLGFVQAPTGDARRWPYAVVTDGRLSIGLHAAGVEEPTLTWVRPGVASHVEQLESLGIELESLRLGPEELHEIAFRDPSGQLVAIVEARSFSPPAPPPAPLPGWFEEYGIPTADLERSARWWDALGLVAFEPVARPFPRVSAAASDLNLGLYDLDLRAPVLVYSDPAMGARIAALRDGGHRFLPRLPRGLDPREHAVLEAPEGTWLLLTAGLE
jgi:catechol 2,3-dioxygenase-like lactoylglutathione lyase family enzyme